MTSSSDNLPQLESIQSLHDLATKLEVCPNYLKNSLYRYPDRERAYIRAEQFKSNGGIRVLHKLAKSKNNKGYTPIRNLQYLTYNWLQSIYQPSSCCHGFVKERSVVSNARVHLGKRLVIKTDIKDFFPSIHYGRVEGMFTKYPFQFGLQAASALARISCLPESEGGALPQGGITSPYIANMLCRKMDFRLMKLAESMRMHYSRYADDLTFSTNVKVDVTVFLARVEEILLDEGFRIQLDKTRVMKPADRQVVTGIILNNGLNVNRRYIKRLRAILYNMERNGVEDTCHKAALKQSHTSYDARDLRLDSKDPVHFLRQIRGQVEWVNHVLRPYKNAPEGRYRSRYDRAFGMLKQVFVICDEYQKTNSSFYLLWREFRNSREMKKSPWRNISGEELLEAIKSTAKTDPRFLYEAKKSIKPTDEDFELWAKKQRSRASYPANCCEAAARLLSGLTNSRSDLLGRIVHQQDNRIESKEIVAFLLQRFFPIKDELTKSIGDEVSSLLRIALSKAETSDSKSYDFWADDHFRNSVILPFKRRFRLTNISKDDTGTHYEEYLRMLGEQYFTKRELNLSKLKFAIYCDVDQLKRGLGNIFQSMNLHARSKEVSISFRTHGQGKSIYIHDFNSVPLDLLPARDVIAHGKLLDAVYGLNGCCHYYIIANFAELDWRRVNMMDATQDPEPCDPQPGFTHELRFPGQ
jgi:RNA-directed DNA polymerase